MCRAAALTVVTILALALPMASCGGPAADPGSQGAEGLVEGDGAWALRQKEYVPLTLPKVRHGRWDLPHERRLVVNLLPDGSVEFRGHVWGLATTGEAERRQVFEALRAALVRSCVEAEARTAGSGCRLPLLIHADRWVRWSWVRDVIGCARESPLEVRVLRWAVHAAGAPGSFHQEAALSPRPTGPAPDDGRRLRVALTGRVREDRAIELRLAVGREAWTATVSEYDAEHGSGPAEVVTALDGARASLVERAAEGEIVELGLPDAERGVPWGAVAGVLDLLLGTGHRTIDVPQLDVRLTLAEPGDLAVDPFRRPDDPVWTPLVVGLSALALVVVFVLTLAPTVGLARRRGRGGKT